MFHFFLLLYLLPFVVNKDVHNYHLDSKSLDEVSEEKDLGVTITCDLTYGQTDGQTNTAWRHRPRLCIASRGKNWVCITYGVPRGSVLGPLVFNKLYIVNAPLLRSFSVCLWRAWAVSKDSFFCKYTSSPHRRCMVRLLKNSATTILPRQGWICRR